MIALKASEIEAVKIQAIPFKGKAMAVKDVTVRWLSKADFDESGAAGYGLRLFTIGPGGEIPVHDHFYVQTMYILSGQFECIEFDPQTGEAVDKRVCGPGDAIFIPSMEPHGMRNLSTTEEGTFLCCICNVREQGCGAS